MVSQYLRLLVFQSRSSLCYRWSSCSACLCLSPTAGKQHTFEEHCHTFNAKTNFACRDVNFLPSDNSNVFLFVFCVFLSHCNVLECQSLFSAIYPRLNCKLSIFFTKEQYITYTPMQRFRNVLLLTFNSLPNWQSVK